MYYNDRNKSSQNHWFNWINYGIGKEEMYYEISQMIEDKINELVPKMIEEYVKSLTEIIKYDVIMTLNGKQVDIENIRTDIEKYVYNEIMKKLR